MLHQLLTRVIGAGIVALLSFSSASAGTRTVEFEVDPIIMLSCVEQVNYTIDTASLLFANDDRIPNFRSRGTSAGSDRKIEARFSADSILNSTNGSLIEIDITNACSVRGIGRGEGFLVTVKPAEQGNLYNEDRSGALAVRDARGRAQTGGAFANRFSIPQDHIRLDRPIRLDVQLRVDMRNADGSGRYGSDVDGVFSIEISAP